jgi:precorrin-6B methylase 2
MNALAAWQERVAACRAARNNADEALWQRLAPWYDQWVQQNDYVELVLPQIRRLLRPQARVLEVGPGTGAFTLPLARIAGEVVAIEPSEGMRAVLARNLAAEGLDHVRLLPQRVEDALAQLDGRHDLALASHSLYNVLDIAEVVRALVSLAPHVVILMGTGHQQAWLARLYRRFKGETPCSPAHFGLFYAVLLEMGIYADVQILWTSANYVYDSVEELVAWWAPRLGCADGDRDELRAALLEQATQQGEQIAILGRQRAALIHIDAERSLFAPAMAEDGD